MDEAALAGVFLGALIPTFIVSRITLWMLRTWQAKFSRLLFAHSVSLLVVAFVAGTGMANGCGFVGIDAAAMYFLPQVVWLCIDSVRHSALAPAAHTEDH